MPLYEVKNGNIDLMSRHGADFGQGWVNVGSETDKLWSETRPGNYNNRVHGIAFTAIDCFLSGNLDVFAQTQLNQTRRTHIGEMPVAFVAAIHFHGDVVPATGLLYRSGFYRGSIQLPEGITPRVVSYAQVYPQWLEAKVL
jgi:hypothetical protein